MKDSEFLRAEKVPMTKQEVRTIVLDKLQLGSASRFVDVGAGTGSIALEAALSFERLHVYAIEKNEHAVEIMHKNMERFGCNHIHLINKMAPCELTGKFDAVFIGGSGGNLEQIIDWALDHLLEGGHLVMNFILHGSLNQALDHLKTCAIDEFECSQIQVSSMTSLGTSYYFKPNNPTFIVSCIKGNQRHG
ncbi:decarboxylating cobalt-precorrin-6B (C(15))-methyltransferase [Vibrio plantisponsor]|uniref:decarboxylating cobalt-precorrin-6B (C(15))-methyltransferase n=1 Tax=Vibrio plantisponsor TaxID=664643 RepID=UPI00370BC85A